KRRPLVNAWRKTIAMWACLILGPVMVILGFAATVKDIHFMTKSTLVEATITGGKTIHASKGSNQIRFSVRFTTPEGKLSDGYLTVYDYQKDKFLNQSPLMLRYLESNPQKLRPEDFFPQGWILIPLGGLMFFIGWRAYHKQRKA
ncbi:MAG: hypothetical protein AAF571_14950, partial [Verrucomicrobiota bacterium]